MSSFLVIIERGSTLVKVKWRLEGSFLYWRVETGSRCLFNLIFWTGISRILADQALILILLSSRMTLILAFYSLLLELSELIPPIVVGLQVLKQDINCQPVVLKLFWLFYLDFLNHNLCSISLLTLLVRTLVYLQEERSLERPC